MIKPALVSSAEPAFGRSFCLIRRVQLGRLLWLPSNKTFVPASEPRISIYVWPNVALALTAGAGYIS
jgi:hypothetical protein